jgi:hypothetical protein
MHRVSTVRWTSMWLSGRWALAGLDIWKKKVGHMEKEGTIAAHWSGLLSGTCAA